MADLLTEARRFRARVLAADSEAAARLARAYAVAFRRIDVELERVTARIARARLAGESVTPAMLYQEGRLQRLRSLVLGEVDKFSAEATTTITGAIDEARALGREGATGLVDSVTPPGISPSLAAHLPTDAVEVAVGHFRSAAIGQMLAPLGQAAAQGVEDAIVSGLAAGRNPRAIAREVREHLGGNATRALTISRTEVMRAHREGAISTYRANRDLLEGWTWVAGLGNRTCASCWAQHGTVHPIDEPMASHPRCRCVAAPLTRSWADLGISGMSEPDPIETGVSLFAKASDETKRSVLGPGAHTAWRGNQVRLQDFIHRDQSALWGPSTRAAGLREARENAARRRAA